VRGVGLEVVDSSTKTLLEITAESACERIIVKIGHYLVKLRVRMYSSVMGHSVNFSVCPVCILLVITTGGQSNLTEGCTAAARDRFSRIR